MENKTDLIKRNYKYASSKIHCSIRGHIYHQYYVNLEYIRIWKYKNVLIDFNVN